MSRRALIVVDPQKDFMPGGALAVPGGDEIVPTINRMLGGTDLAEQWDLVVMTADDHPAGHCSFKEQGGPWPVHCVRDTKGAEFPHGLILGEPQDPQLFAIINKGQDLAVDSYSAFFDNNREHKTGLAAALREWHIDEIFVCGLATDYCVRFTVLDACSLCIPTTVLIDACRAVNVEPLDEKKALVEMARAGAELTVVDKTFR